MKAIDRGIEELREGKFDLPGCGHWNLVGSGFTESILRSTVKAALEEVRAAVETNPGRTFEMINNAIDSIEGEGE